MRTINFHGVGTPGPSIDPSEAPYWISADYFEEITTRIKGSADVGRIAITFDDGNLSDLEIAAPILKQHGLEARFFVLTGRMDMSGYLGLPEIRDLIDMGFVIGSHGRDHISWAGLEPDALDRETAGSKRTLEQQLGQPVTEAAIPFGNYDRKTLAALRRAGYAAAWTSDGGDMDMTRFLRPRMSVRSDMTIAAVEKALFAPIPPLRRARRKLAMARKRFL